MKTMKDAQTVSYGFTSAGSGKSYSLSLGKDGNVYCSCPAWRFQKTAAGKRTCKHIKAFERKSFENPLFQPVDGMVL